MNDNGHSQSSIKIPRCIQQLDRTSAAMAMASETQIFCNFVYIWFKQKLKSFSCKPKLRLEF